MTVKLMGTKEISNDVILKGTKVSKKLSFFGTFFICLEYKILIQDLHYQFLKMI